MGGHGDGKKSVRGDWQGSVNEAMEDGFHSCRRLSPIKSFIVSLCVSYL